MNDLVKQDNAVGFTDSDFDNLGPEQNLTSNDIAIPKLLIMQAQFPRVIEQEASLGELVDSLNWKVFAQSATTKRDSKPCEFIPFHWQKFWIIRKYNPQSKRWDFESMFKQDATNEGLNPYEEWEGEDHQLRKRVYLHLFYGLVPGNPIPFALGLKGSSKKAGDNIVTQMFTLNRSLKVKEAYKKSPMAKTIALNLKTTTKDGSTFAVVETSVARDTTKEEAYEALKWAKQISAGEAKVDHSDLQDGEF